MSDKKRKSFTLQFKLDAVNYAQNNSNSKAAEHFGVHVSQIVRWKKQKDQIVAKPKKETKHLKKNRPIQWPEIESHLKMWVIDRRKSGFPVSGCSILREARAYAMREKIEKFKGSSFWVFKFMKRNSLALRAVTSVGQKLPADWEEKMRKFVEFVTQHKGDFSLAHIGNMDEVPVTFDMPSKFTIDVKGSNDVRITTTGAEKNRFTVVLCVTADGKKLPAYVIFRRKTIPSGSFPSNIIVSANEKSCMTSSETQLWHAKVWMKRKMAMFHRKSVLMLDSAPGHRTDEAKLKFSSGGTLIAMIPGGLTKKLQVLDISVNKSFKAYLRQHWEKWMINGVKEYTKNGNLKKASCEEICRWISEAWRAVPSSAIKNGFRKTTIDFYNDVDKNNENIQEDEESEDEIEDFVEEENNEDRTIREQLTDVFLYEENFFSDEEDFE